MSIQTVLGKIEKDALGIVLPHEHVYINSIVNIPVPEEIGARNLFFEKVTMDKLGYLKRDPLAMLDNLQMFDEQTQYDEIMFFKYAGGKTIVDQTTLGMGRDPQLIKRMAIRTGLNIIAPAGFFTEGVTPKEVIGRSEKELELEIIDQLRNGFPHTDVKAGVIGEVGISEYMTPFEIKALAASCRAQVETGAPLSIHVNPWAPRAYEVMEIIEEHKVDPSKVVICHLNMNNDIDYIKGLLDKGIYIGFEDWGRDITRDLKHCRYGLGRFLSDWENLDLLKKILDMGHVKQMLISMDVCRKQMQRTYGGWGLNHILTNVIPMMKEVGITQTQIDEMIIHNPARWLDVKCNA